MTRFLFLFSCLLLLPLSETWATTMELSANPSQATAYQRILLTVKVDDGKLKAPPDIQGADAFEITSSGTSSSFSIVNGVASSSVTYSFILSTGKVGSYTISTEAEDENGKVVSNKVAVTIKEANDKQQSTDGLDKTFVKVEIGSGQSYLHEQINYKLKFYTAYQIQETKLTLPPFEGFWVEDVGKEKQYQETVDGQQYLVYEINKSLFPQKTGTFELEPAKIFCSIVTQEERNRSKGGFPNDPFFNDPFFSNPFARTQLVDKTVVSNKTTLEVKPIPLGEPGDDTELVGNFHISVSISARELKVGESTTLTIQVSGDGNLSLLELPNLDIESMKEYKDKPMISQALHGDKIIYTKDFKVALIPEKAGEVVIPAIQIPYFSSFENKWLKMEGKEITLTVSEGIQGTKPDSDPTLSPQIEANRPQKVDVVGKDILPAFINAELFEDENTRSYVGRILLVGLFLLVAFGGTVYYFFRFHQTRVDVNYLRRAKAAANALKALEGAKGIEEVSSVLRGYVGDKTGKSGTALAREEMRVLLENSGVSAEQSKEFLELQDEIDAALYGGQLPEAGIAGFRNRCESIIQKLDKSL